MMLDKKSCEKILRDLAVRVQDTDCMVNIPVISMIGQNGRMLPMTHQAPMSSITLMDCCILLDLERPVYIPYDNILYITQSK